MEINHHKTDSILNLGQVDIQAISQELDRLAITDWDTPEDFEANYNKRPNTVLNNTSHIIYRFSNKQVKPFSYHSYSRWETWKDILLPVMNQATAPYSYSKGVYTRVMLAKLSPKSFIPPHTDGNSNGSIPHKIHIPIETNEDSFFYVKDQKFHLKRGLAYEVNNGVKHAVVNNGTTDRIHLIFEYLDYDLQADLIQQEIDKQ